MKYAVQEMIPFYVERNYIDEVVKPNMKQELLQVAIKEMGNTIFTCQYTEQVIAGARATEVSMTIECVPVTMKHVAMYEPPTQRYDFTIPITVAPKPEPKKTFWQKACDYAKFMCKEVEYVQ